jgi:hypothetical protein
LPVSRAGVFRRQGGDHAGDLSEMAEIRRGAAHDHRVVVAFQVHDEPRAGVIACGHHLAMPGRPTG